MTAVRKTDIPKIFRITLEVSNIDEAAAFYAKLLGTEGKRHPGARHYFDCGGVILSVLDPTAGGLTPTPGPKSSTSRCTTSIRCTPARAGSRRSLRTRYTASPPAR